MTTACPIHTRWVDSDPFRAHVCALQAETGLPWRAIALAAGVSPRCVGSLLHGRQGRRVRRLRSVDAAALMHLDVAAVQGLRTSHVSARTAQAAGLHLLSRGASIDTLARWCQTPVSELRAVLGGARWCRAIVSLHLRAAADAVGWVPGDELHAVAPSMLDVTAPAQAAA